MFGLSTGQASRAEYLESTFVGTVCWEPCVLLANVLSQDVLRETLFRNRSRGKTFVGMLSRETVRLWGNVRRSAQREKESSFVLPGELCCLYVLCFVAVQWEMMRVHQLVKGIREGRIQVNPRKKEAKDSYQIWKEDDDIPDK